MSRVPFVIRNDLELHKAMDRAAELSRQPESGKSRRDLRKIAEAIKVYTESMRVLRMVDRNPHVTSEFASDD